MATFNRLVAVAAFARGTQAFHEGEGGPCFVNAWQHSRWFENLATMDHSCSRDGAPDATCNLNCRYGYEGTPISYKCVDSEWVPENETSPEFPQCDMVKYFCRVTVYDSCDKAWKPLEQQEVPGEFHLSGTVKAVWVQGENCIGQLAIKGEYETPPWTFTTDQKTNESFYTDCDDELPMGWGGRYDTLRVWRNLEEKCAMVSGYKFRKLGLAPCRAKYWIRDHI